MHHTIFVFTIFLKIILVSANSYSVNVGTDKHVNLVDKKFLSFTIDPKYLFSNGKYSSKECICMASVLTPAFIRIAGPSTALMSYQNTSIAIEEPFEGRRSRFQSLFGDNLARIDDALRGRREERKEERKEEEGIEALRIYDGRRRKEGKEEGRFKRHHNRLEVSHSRWRQFVRWAKSTGFELVFAVNNHDKMASGIWDPNMALNILTVAEKADIGTIYWQLGYECSNQSIEEYLNDLETLRVIIETFPPGQKGEWKLVGGDVTDCLLPGSKSDFKDYVTLSSDMMDAILLNGNSSTAELARMSERDRLKLLKLLSSSTTPLWLTEQPWLEVAETSRAADWLTSLGHAARNGFSVHYRELDEEEMYQPTLSFYMALLFKNLVGEKVLHVEMEPEQAIMFAHCTSLRHKDVPGAVTLYGVNLDSEPARFSIKLGQREEGGDVMQFVLGRDRSGNIIVNGKPMYHEGDLKPVVKRVRPYKTLLLNLPAKSFGFWVLANTKVDACFAEEKYNETVHIDDAVPLSQEQDKLVSKRSINVNDFEEYTNEADVSVDFCDGNDVTEESTNEDLKDCIENIHKDLSTVKDKFTNPANKPRTKRQTGERKPGIKIRHLIRNTFKSRNPKSEVEFKPKRLNDLLKTTRSQVTRLLKRQKINIKKPHNENKLIKGQSDSKAKKKISYRKRERKEDFGGSINYQASPIKRNLEKDIKMSNNIIEANDRKANQVLKDKSKPIIIDRTSFELKQSTEEKTRTRRSTKDEVEFSAENDIVVDGKKEEELWKLLQKIHKQIKEISDENDEYDDVETEADYSKASTRSHNKRDKEEDLKYDVDLGNDTTFFKTTLQNLLRVISDLNNNLNRFWNGIRLLD